MTVVYCKYISTNFDENVVELLEMTRGASDLSCYSVDSLKRSLYLLDCSKYSLNSV